MSHDTEKIEQDVQAVIADDAPAITNRVRKITLDALSSGELNSAALKQVMEAVVKGARQGIVSPDEAKITALKDAVKGLEEALAAAATATHLTVQEAASRTSEFSKESLSKAVDELASMESQFINSISHAAKQSSGHVQTTLRDIADHAKSSGTVIGSQVKTALEQLAQAVSSTARDQAAAGTETLHKETTLLAGLAAGVLKGIADRLQPPNSL